ncbi:cyclic lactone autoinducer peptide [Sporosarcina sp. FSL K6-3457]
MLKLVAKVLIFWGTIGSKQMCHGVFHEMETPEELKNIDF